MATVKELAEYFDRLNRRGHSDEEVYAQDGSSGVSYELCTPSIREKKRYDDAGPLCELEDGTQIIVCSLD